MAALARALGFDLARTAGPTAGAAGIGAAKTAAAANAAPAKVPKALDWGWFLQQGGTPEQLETLSNQPVLLLNLEATGRLQEHIQHDFERQHLSCRNLPTLLRIVEVEKGQLSLSYFRVRGGMEVGVVSAATVCAYEAERVQQELAACFASRGFALTTGIQECVAQYVGDCRAQLGRLVRAHRHCRVQARFADAASTSLAGILSLGAQQGMDATLLGGLGAYLLGVGADVSIAGLYTVPDGTRVQVGVACCAGAACMADAAATGRELNGHPVGLFRTPAEPEEQVAPAFWRLRCRLSEVQGYLACTVECLEALGLEPSPVTRLVQAKLAELSSTVLPGQPVPLPPSGCRLRVRLVEACAQHSAAQVQAVGLAVQGTNAQVAAMGEAQGQLTGRVSALEDLVVGHLMQQFSSVQMQLGRREQWERQTELRLAGVQHTQEVLGEELEGFAAGSHALAQEVRQLGSAQQQQHDQALVWQHQHAAALKQHQARQEQREQQVDLRLAGVEHTQEVLGEELEELQALSVMVQVPALSGKRKADHGDGALPAADTACGGRGAKMARRDEAMCTPLRPANGRQHSEAPDPRTQPVAAGARRGPQLHDVEGLGAGIRLLTQPAAEAAVPLCEAARESTLVGCSTFCPL